MKILKLNISEHKFLYLLFLYAILVSILIPLMLYLNSKLISAILMAPLLLIILLTNFDSFIKIGLMICMFVGYYLNITYRIQLINLFSYVLIFYYLINFNSETFNSFKLPLRVKITSAMLISAVVLSSINSPYFSFISIYYGLMFIIYILTGFIIFKNIFSLSDIDDYLKNFIYVCAFYGILIIISIFMTGYLRARGVTGTSFSDIIVCALLVVLFKHLFVEKYNVIHILVATILLIVLITDQSRFAWVGFALSLLYGLIVMSVYQKNERTKRIVLYVILSVILGITLVYISGLYKIIFTRFSDVSFSILQSSDQKEIVGNSLDTRGLIWITAFSAFVNNPLTGVGYFMFHSVSEYYNILPYPVYEGIVMGLDAHSTMMNFLSETGIIGIISLTLFFTVVFFISIKSIKIAKSEHDLTRSIILNILVFFIETTSIYSGAYTFGYNGYFLYFIFALVVSNYVLLKKKLINVEIN